ncbi:MAG: putative transporter [Bacteroidota bacterium]
MFDFVKHLLLPAAEPGAAQTVIAVGLATSLGILLGKIKIAKVSIGVAGVLFAGILLGHLGYRLNLETMDFLRDFGLILFVYAVGLQVGPSFFSSLKSEGLVLNLLTAGAIILSVVITIIILKTTGTAPENMAGIMSGAVTNTPGLGAAKNALNEIAAANPGKTFGNPANGYAIAYPFGAIGEILMILLIKKIFKINVKTEMSNFESKRLLQYPHPSNIKVRITNPAVFGKTIGDIKDQIGELIITRLKNSGSTTVITPGADTVLQERDVLMLVGLPEQLNKAVPVLGRESSDTFVLSDEEVETRDITVTNSKSTQKSLAQLNFEGAYNTKVTRIFRAGVELIATPAFVLHFGDTVRMVGPKTSLQDAIKELGNSAKKLQEPELATVFIGIMLGLLLGSIPIMIPGLPVPVKLGIAAGPLLVAIFISRYGGLATLHSYMNQSAILFMRDFGICLFFAAVGINAGKTLVSSFVENNGWMWLIYGICITAIPVFLLGVIARWVFKINFLQIAGVMGGTYTSPPTLTFCNSFFKSDIPAQSYATVYPLAIILRILAAQLFVLTFAG